MEISCSPVSGLSIMILNKAAGDKKVMLFDPSFKDDEIEMTFFTPPTKVDSDQVVKYNMYHPWLCKHIYFELGELEENGQERKGSVYDAFDKKIIIHQMDANGARLQNEYPIPKDPYQESDVLMAMIEERGVRFDFYSRMEFNMPKKCYFRIDFEKEKDLKINIV